MNAELKAKFRRRLNAYADIWRWEPKDKRLQRRADRLIEDIYLEGHDQGAIADYGPTWCESEIGEASEAGVADVMEFHKAAGGQR